MIPRNQHTGTHIQCGDELPSLDVFELKKLGLLEENVKTFDWRLAYPGGKFRDLHIEVTPNALFIYRSKINLIHVRQHFGGARQVFQCPVCRCQAYKLFEREERFECRRCCGYVHRSRRLTKRDRLLSRAAKIDLKLEGSLLRNGTVARLLAERDRLIIQAAEIDLERIIKRFKLEGLTFKMLSETCDKWHVDAI